MGEPFDNLRDIRPLPPDVQLGIEVRHGENQLAVGEPGDPIVVTVGQILQHLAVSNVPILAVTWQIQGPVLKGYLMSPAVGAPVTVTPADLSGNPINFAWLSPGTYLVAVYIVTAYGSGWVSHTWQVTAPTVTGFTSQTQSVAVQNTGPGQGMLQFGGQGSPGIRFFADVEGTQSVPGQVAGIQLANNQRTVVDDGGAPWHWSLNGQWVLDVGPPPGSVIYQNVQEPLAPGGQCELQLTDSPGQGLGGDFTHFGVGTAPAVIPESYCMYVGFFPAAPSIWVPLARMTWNWQGASTLAGGNWGPVESPDNSNNPTGGPTTDLPDWTQNTSQGAWMQGARAPVPSDDRPDARSAPL